MMTFKGRIMFFTIIFSQFVVLLVYLGFREWWHENLHFRRREPGKFEKFLDNSTFHASYITRPGTRIFPVVAGTSAKPSFLTTFTESERHTRKEKYGGLSDLQDHLPVNQTTLGPSDHQKQLHFNVTTPRLPKQEYFQSVDGKEAWFYSAFYDYVAAGQGHPSVRLIGVVDNKFLVTAFCNLSLVNGTNLSTNASVQPLPDSHMQSFSPSYLACPLPSNVRPTHVSISFQEKVTPTNRLMVQYPGPRIRNFTVCFSVLHSNNKLTSQFIQSIEMNQILGAEHFMVYNYSVSAQLEKIMRRYEDDGILTINEWPIPTNKSHYFSQTAALNDCVYRNRNTSRFVVVVDTDELIIPRNNNNNWMELINTISPQEVDVSYFMNSSVKPKSRTSYTGCFLFRSSYFARDSIPKWDNLPKQYYFDDKEKTNILKYNILALSQFMRQDKIYPHNVKTKYIARPELVFNTGIHRVYDFVYRMRCVNVNENLALVHHYRTWNLKTDFVNDTSILQYKHLLYPRFMQQLKRFLYTPRR